MIRILMIAIGVVLLAGAPAPALARPRVAIVEFEKDSSGELQDVVAEALEDDFAIIGPRKVTRALDKLGLDTELSAKQLKKLARELEADAIIRGSVSRKSGRKILHLRLFLNGKKIRGFKAEFVNASSPKLRDALRDKLRERLGAAIEDRGESDPPPKKDKIKEPVETTEDTGEDAGPVEGNIDAEAGTEGAGEGEGEGDDEGDEDGGEEDPLGSKAVAVKTTTEPATAGAALNRVAIRADLGLSLQRRSLAFTARSYEEAPQPYANAPVPGARVEVEVYPFAFSNPNSFLAGLGIGGSFDQTLILNLESTVQPGTKFPVTQNSWSVGGRLRLVFGKKATSPSLVLRAGLGSRTFEVDRTQLMPGNVIDLPDVGYKGYSAGGELRFPVSPKVALLAGAAGIFVTTTGAIQTAEQYGQAQVTGVDARIGADIAVGKRFAVKIVADLTQMGFAFTGAGEMTNNRDGDPDTRDIGGATDRYLSGSAMFGVVY